MPIKKVLAGYKERHNIRELADKLNINYPAMVRMLNENDSYAFCVSKVVDLIEATNDFTLLDEIELRLGRVAQLIQTPQYDFNFLGFSQLIKESGEATRAISDAFADGRVSPQEATNCIKELKDCIYAAVQLIQSLEAIEKDGKDFSLLKSK
jgi:hypothetical protein